MACRCPGWHRCTWRPRPARHRTGSCALRRPVIASAVETCVPLSSASPSLAAKRQRRQADRGQRLGRRQLAAGEPDPPDADQRRGDVGQGCQIARGARPSPGRGSPAGRRRRAAAAGRRWSPRCTPERPRPRLAAFSSSTSRTVASSSGAPTPHMCERTSRRCSSAMSAGGNAHPGELAEAGVDPIDGAPRRPRAPRDRAAAPMARARRPGRAPAEPAVRRTRAARPADRACRGPEVADRPSLPPDHLCRAAVAPGSAC